MDKELEELIGEFEKQASAGNYECMSIELVYILIPKAYHTGQVVERQRIREMIEEKRREHPHQLTKGWNQALDDILNSLTGEETESNETATPQT